MTNNYQQQAEEMVEKGRQSTSGMVTGGEMLIDADPDNGFFRVKLRGIQPPEMTAQLVNGLCWVLAKGGAMFNLPVKQHVKEPDGSAED